MRIFGFGYCTNHYLNLIGVAPNDRVNLSLQDFLSLVKYSKTFFQNAPFEARLIAGLSGPKRLSYNGFEMVLASMLDLNSINIPFVIDSICEEPLLMKILKPIQSSLIAWSRRYIDEMPKELKIDIFNQKLKTQRGYQEFKEKHPHYQLVDVNDFSSGRYFTQRSVYKLNFKNQATGTNACCILKPSIKTNFISNKPVNEEFYSRYLDLFDRKPTKIRLYDKLNFIEFVEGIPSRNLFTDHKLAPKYTHLRNDLLTWFAQEAALADAVTKGDRDIGLLGNQIWGNCIMVPNKDGKLIERMVSIDHEFIFNRTDNFTVQSTEKGLLEICVLAALPEFKDASQRQALFEEFKAHYKKMFRQIQAKQTTVEKLVGRYYGDEEIEILRRNLKKEPDAWLKMLLEKVEIFFSKQK